MKFSKSKNYLFYLLSASLLALIFNACTKTETAPVYDEITTEVLKEEKFYFIQPEELANLSIEELKDYYENDFTQEEFEQLREEFKDYVPESNATTAASSRSCGGPSYYVSNTCWIVNDCASGKRRWEQRYEYCGPSRRYFWVRQYCCNGPGPH